MPHFEFNLDFGIRIQELRKREGKMSLRELARRVGISPSYLSQIEQGKLPPPVTNVPLVIRFAQELNEDPKNLQVLTKRPTHKLSDLLSTHPEIPNLLAEAFIGVEGKHLNSVVLVTALQMLVTDEYGKFLDYPYEDEADDLTNRVIRIHKRIRKRRVKP